MGQRCTKCSVGNPCTDPTCHKYGSGHLRDLVEQIREKYQVLQESIRNDERNESWLQTVDRKFEKRITLSPEGFKHHSNNVRDYFSTPQPKIDDLESVENRLAICLNTHKEGEYLDCQNNARELVDLANQGRDQPAHCKTNPNPYECTYESPKSDGTGTNLGFGLGTGFKATSKKSESQSFGRCYS